MAQVLEQFAGDDDVEGFVCELEWGVEVGVMRLHAELRGLRERIAVRVHADHLVPLRVGAGQRAVAAAEVEDAPPRPVDVAAKENGALGPGEHEARAALAPVVLGIPLAELVQGHARPKSTLARVSTKPVAPVENPPAPAEDIRSVRPYLFTRTTLAAFVRRL